MICLKINLFQVTFIVIIFFKLSLVDGIFSKCSLCPFNNNFTAIFWKQSYLSSLTIFSILINIFLTLRSENKSPYAFWWKIVLKTQIWTQGHLGTVRGPAAAWPVSFLTFLLRRTLHSGCQLGIFAVMRPCSWRWPGLGHHPLLSGLLH